MLVLPEFVPQVAKVVVTRTTIVVSDAMCEPYTDGSIVIIILPLSFVESAMTAQFEIAAPSALSAMVYTLVPQRPVNKLAVSTPSPGMSNSAVAVAPSNTEIVVGLNVMLSIVVVLHGLVTSMVREVAVGVNTVVEPYPWLPAIVSVGVRVTA